MEELLKLAQGVTVQQAAVVLMLASAGYIIVKTVRLRKLGLHRRKEDPRIAQMQAAMDKMKRDAEAEVRALRESVSTVEGIARNAVARVEQVGEDFVELREYVHDMSHKISNDLQSMTRAIGNVEGSLSGLSQNVGRMLGVLMAK